MKANIIKLLGSAAVLLGMVSCTKELLNKNPVSSLPAEGFYENMSDARAGIFGIYNSAQSVFRTNFAYWGEGRADNVKTTHSGDELNLSQNNLNESLSSANWTQLYTLISRANYAIKFIPGIGNGDMDGGKAQLVGQARALRALAYFYLVKVWGDVPLITEPYLSIDQEIFVEKTSSEKVLDQVEEDLNYAAKNCVDRYGSNNDRIMITQGTANALLTQVYMWRHKFPEAVEVSSLVMNNSLYSLAPSMADWGKIFTNGYSNESIFEIGFEDGQATNSLRVLYAIGADAIYTPSERFKASYEPGDQRIPYTYDTTLAQPKAIWKFLGKGMNDEDPSPSDQNIVLIRLAGIMLLRAEALTAVGGDSNIGEAIGLLNKVRERAGLPAFANESEAVVAYGSLQNAILHERSVELAFEGHRWFDLVRTNKAISTMQPVNGLSNEKNLVWPISRDALDKNPRLEQNEFYK